MASTRNNNTPSDYCLQQRSYKNSRTYTDYEHSQVGRAYKNALPCMGITPSHMPREAFSNNSVEIESALFGINSTNLVNPEKPVIPQLKTLPEISYFERLPTYIPEPLVVEKDQRPFPIPK
jgi:hypothetical protein